MEAYPFATQVNELSRNQTAAFNILVWALGEIIFNGAHSEDIQQGTHLPTIVLLLLFKPLFKVSQQYICPLSEL